MLSDSYLLFLLLLPCEIAFVREICGWAWAGYCEYEMDTRGLWDWANGVGMGFERLFTGILWEVAG